MRLKGWSSYKNLWRMWDNHCIRANTNVRPYTHFKCGKLRLNRVAAPILVLFLVTYRKDFLPNEVIASLKVRVSQIVNLSTLHILS